MDNIYVDYYAFFVPNRLVMSNWKQFMGENTSSYGAASAVNYPQTSITTASRGCGPMSIGDYMGLPDLRNSSGSCQVSSLPGRAYFLIYNEWFRDQNLVSPLSINFSNTNPGIAIATDPNNSNANLFYSSPCLKAAKESDYFTRALPYAQKGNPVSLPLGTTAPVVGVQEQGDIDLGDSLNVFAGGAINSTSNGIIKVENQDNNYAHLVADLSTATAATINQLRFAFQYQKFLEKDALYGTRYWEILKGHFGITAPDASLQRPELLGHFRQHINIDQVLQTSESGTTALGTPGANSVSGKHDHLISKSFVEHGILMILAVARHDQTYGQGINRMWSRSTREEFYFPVFANLGAQEILRKEIYANGTNDKSNDLALFGYQEAWAEYRYRPSQVSGIIKPSAANSLGFWSLANNFANAPTLSKSFIEQDRSNLSRALTTGNNGPDFIADFYFDAVYVRPMPIYSIPGLIDHH